ncbi:MAG: TonB C-terminal domain-containing protein [Deltaproteobacteria bacterium]|jgi:outer membrane biosynthesis protein TonB|nr:TonB C-terminal domain-containing protein [Deltaproteobacteria bacterium]
MPSGGYYDKYILKAEASEGLGLVFLISLGLHSLFLGGLIFLPGFLDLGKPSELPFEAMTVQLVGGLDPPAPAAPPAPVDPNLNLPDVVELPKAEPILPQPTPLERMITPPTPSEVIPIGQTPPDIPPPVVKREEPPPKVQIPEKTPDPPPPEVKKKPTPVNPPRKTTNTAIEELKRKKAAEDANREIDSVVADLAKSRGQGDGTSSAPNSGYNEGSRIDPIKAQYYNEIKEIVRSNWVAPISAFNSSSNLGAIYVIVIQPNGRISGKNLRRSSGDQEFDNSVEQAIVRSRFPPLPPVFDGRADNPALQFELAYLNRGG